MAKRNAFQQAIKPLASLKLAVFVILAMATMSAWGTIYEAMYNDARRAQEVVYHSWYSYSIFALLTINLIAVIIDRYPWKRHHIGFISAHVGIIMMIGGAIATRYLGVDGSLAFNIGETKRRVSIQNTDILVYSGLSSGGARKVFEKEVSFLSNPPSEKNPFEINLGNDKIVIDDFKYYTFPKNKVESSKKVTDGPALRFQISNERVSQSEWLLLGKEPFDEKNLGPAKVVLSYKDRYKYQGGNVLLLETMVGKEDMTYKVFTASKNGLSAQGVAKAGDAIETGWMGLTFRILKYHPHATSKYIYEPIETSVEGAIAAIRFKFNGKEYWTGLNSSVRLFSDDSYHVFVFANRQIELDFNIKLDEFRVGRYQGTMRAASYESDVSVIEPQKDNFKTTISMNEPLYHGGFTFYQSSFQEDEMGRPTMSILSVNYDPGRFWKYLGSILMVFGIIHLFYFKKRENA